MLRRLVVALWIAPLLGILLALPASGEEGAAAPTHPTPAAVRAELQETCRRLTEGGNPFFGWARARRIEEVLARPGLSATQSLQLRGARAVELFRLGEVERAVEVLEGVREELDDTVRATEPQLEPFLLFHLALARLRLGEEGNCIAAHTPASCILPIAPEAVHRQPAQARAAGDLFLELLTRFGDHVQARWLLNLSRMVSGDYPEGVPKRYRVPGGVLPPADAPGRWPDLSDALGVKVFDLGGGAAMEDLDGDGLLDLLSGTWDPCDGTKAFRNQGDGTFTDVSSAWGLDAQLGAFNIMPGDFDGDGRVDLLLLRGGWLGEDGRIRNTLLRNDLHRPAGRFTDVTAAAGLADPAYPTQTAGWADFDGDGDLDLYVGNESRTQNVNPLIVSAGESRSYPSQLFRNEGDGTFTDVAPELGVTNDRWTKAVAWGDYDNDGDPDLYLSNIGPNRLYRNDGEEGFTDVAPRLDVMGPVRSFPTWFFDYDNDGWLDLFVARYGTAVEDISASYLGETIEDGNPVLYRNLGGRFDDVSEAAGLARPSLPMGSNFGDLDGDGFPGFYLGTGVPSSNALMPNQAYRNRGGVFEDVTFELGLGHLQKGHGVAFGDLDGDGDLDLFQQMGGAFPFDDYGNVLYENPGTAGHRWLVLRLRGTKANRIGLGARIEVKVRRGEERWSIHAVAGTGGSFGASSLQQEIGLGDAEAVEEVVVRWPGSGTVQRFRSVAPNAAYRVTEDAEELERIPYPAFDLPAPGSAHPHRHPASEPARKRGPAPR